MLMSEFFFVVVLWNHFCCFGNYFCYCWRYSSYCCCCGCGFSWCSSLLMVEIEQIIQESFGRLSPIQQSYGRSSPIQQSLGLFSAFRRVCSSAFFKKRLWSLRNSSAKSPRSGCSGSGSLTNAINAWITE